MRRHPKHEPPDSTPAQWFAASFAGIVVMLLLSSFDLTTFLQTPEPLVFGLVCGWIVGWALEPARLIRKKN